MSRKRGKMKNYNIKRVLLVLQHDGDGESDQMKRYRWMGWLVGWEHQMKTSRL